MDRVRVYDGDGFVDLGYHEWDRLCDAIDNNGAVICELLTGGECYIKPWEVVSFARMTQAQFEATIRQDIEDELTRERIRKELAPPEVDW